MGRTPTSDRQVGTRIVFIGVSPTKYDNFLLVIDLFIVHVASFVTPHYNDSFMICPTGYAPKCLSHQVPSFEQVFEQDKP